MSNLSFTKYQAAGNDFILIDDRLGIFPKSTSVIRKLLHRKFGIGADGLILLQDEFRMRIYNSDGSEAENCGNGLRCLAWFLRDLQLVPPFIIRTQHGQAHLDFNGEFAFVELGSPCNMKLNVLKDLHFIDTGVPHVVQFVSDCKNIDLDKAGTFFRHHPMFAPQGANVNFATVRDGFLEVRTFERGVEGETLSCGTGAVAVAKIAEVLFDVAFPLAIHFPGGRLIVKKDGNHFLLGGPVEKVYCGSIFD